MRGLAVEREGLLDSDPFQVPHWGSLYHLGLFTIYFLCIFV